MTEKNEGIEKMDKSPLVFRRTSKDFHEQFLAEGPFDTPKKMFANINSAFKSGYQVGYEVTVNFENFINTRPTTKNDLVYMFKVGLFNGINRGRLDSIKK